MKKPKPKNFNLPYEQSEYNKAIQVYMLDLEHKQKQMLNLLSRAKQKHIPYHSKLWDEIERILSY